MDFGAPVSTIMTRQLLTVGPYDPLEEVRLIFERHRIHHVPVVHFRTLIGMISKGDFLHFTRGISRSVYDNIIEESRLRNYKAEDIMTRDLVTLQHSDTVSSALAIFLQNQFHAIPVLKNSELEGILTTYDILRLLAKAHAVEYQESEIKHDAHDQY